MNPALNISLPRFEGPLDLLLDLVRKHEIDIADIPISEVTRQYLDYLRRAEQLDIDLGAEYTYIAALLIHIKSRSLLTPDPELAASEEDPRQELIRLLLDHDQVRSGAEFLRQKLELAQATWSKSAAPEFQEEDNGSASLEGTINLLEVLRLAKQALETARAYELIFPTESVTVEEMEHWLDQRIDTDFEEGTVDQFLAEQPTTERKAVLFLALLEKAKSGRMQLEQIECFGPIKICLHPSRHNCAATSTNR
jgi:segregation and condensation protein A